MSAVPLRSFLRYAPEQPSAAASSATAVMCNKRKLFLQKNKRSAASNIFRQKNKKPAALQGKSKPCTYIISTNPCKTTHKSCLYSRIDNSGLVFKILPHNIFFQPQQILFVLIRKRNAPDYYSQNQKEKSDYHKGINIKFSFLHFYRVPCHEKKII